MYQDKVQRRDRTAVIVFSLIMIAMVVGGLGYAAHEFLGVLHELESQLNQAGQVIGNCL